MTDNTLTQVPLFEPTRPEWFTCEMATRDLPPNTELLSSEPARSLIASVYTNGVLENLKLAYTERGAFLVAGCRRLKALRLLAEKYPEEERFTRVRVDFARDVPWLEAMVLRSISNNQRSANELADIDALQTVLERQPGIELKELATQTGIPLQKIKKLLPVTQVPQLFKLGVIKGYLSESTLVGLSKLPRSYIDQAVVLYSDRLAKLVSEEAMGKEHKQTPILLTQGDLVDFQRVRRMEANSQLPIPNMLGTTPPPQDENEILDHLQDFMVENGVGEEIVGYAVYDPEYNRLLSNPGTQEEANYFLEMEQGVDTQRFIVKLVKL